MSPVTTSKRAPKGTARRALDDAMTEDQWKREVLEYAGLGGWQVVHFLPATVVRRGRRRTMTHQEGQAGFPDLVLARRGVVLVRELKREDGALSAGQREWLEHLGELGGVWRPRDREVVRATLLEGVQVSARNLPA
jgi:hypothetical protein